MRQLISYGKVFVYFFFITIQLIAYGQTFKKFDIHGKLNSKYSGPISLRYHIIPDSPLFYQTEVIDGNFYFKVDLSEPVAAVLSLPSPTLSEYMYLDTSEMIINANIDSVKVNDKVLSELKILNIKGSESQRIYTDLMRSWKEIHGSGLPEKIQSDYLFSTLDSLVKLYPDHNILTQALLFSEILSYSQALKIHDQLSIRQQKRSSINGIDNLLARLKRTDIGTSVVFKDLKNEKDEPVTLEKIPPSIILLDFWASWCLPCRETHPELKNLYKKYHSKGFNIISISLDNNKDKWIKAIKDDKIDWINASDLKGFSGYMASFYSLSYLPFNLLIDENSKILGKNVSTIQIQNILEGKATK